MNSSKILKISEFRSSNSLEKLIVHKIERNSQNERKRKENSPPLIILPTDTVYGLCCLLGDEWRIYEVKKRPSGKPLSLFESNFERCENLVYNLPSRSLLEEIWPGKLTLILRPRENFRQTRFGSKNRSIALRIPNCSLIRNIIDKCGEPLVQTSANLSGLKDPDCIEDLQEIEDKVDLIVDNGHLGSNHLPSTIFDLTNIGRFKVLRRG
ncbi:MAG: hypothetical protein MHMPM18_003891, partial [Marteilia pararefringens]